MRFPKTKFASLSMKPLFAETFIATKIPANSHTTKVIPTAAAIGEKSQYAFGRIFEAKSVYPKNSPAKKSQG